MLFDFFRKSSTTRREDKVWFSRSHKYRGICQEIAQVQRVRGIVVVVAFFRRSWTEVAHHLTQQAIRHTPHQETLSHATLLSLFNRTPEGGVSLVLAEAASEKYIKANPATDEEIRAEFDAQVATMPKEYKARHILVDSKESADAIIVKLQGGGDFAKLASSESKDSSASNGGDLGWFSPQTMVKPFADAVVALEKGKFTPQPVQSEFGWHVILLEDVRSPEVPDFEQVKPQVEMFTQRKKLQAYLDELRKTASIQK